MTNVNGMFANESKNTVGARNLAGTAQLTSLSENIASDIMKTIEGAFEEHRELLESSKTDHDKMDKLIAATYDLASVDVSFLKDLDEETIDGMLKSQQSKRSRAKSKTMTFDNFMSMMTGAVAENLIRTATGKSKSAGTRRVGVSYTDEDLKTLAEDQEALRKEIRNIQSKKSIMKSKADFDEHSEEYQDILKAEETLKALRVGGTTDVIRTELTEIFGDTNIDELKAADAKELLKKLHEALNK